MRLESVYRSKQTIIVFVRMCFGELSVLACWRVLTVGDLVLVPGDFRLMGQDACLVLEDRRLGLLEDRQRLEMIMTPTEMVLAMSLMFRMGVFIGFGHAWPFKDQSVSWVPVACYLSSDKDRASVAVRMK